MARGRLPLPGNHDERLWLDTPYRRPSRFNALARRRATWAAAQLGPRRGDLLRRLPRRLRLSPAPGQDLPIVHADVRDPLEGDALAPDTTDAALAARFGGAAARVIAFGHRHQAAVRAWEAALLVNVAAVSLPRDGRPLTACTPLGACN